MTKLYKVWVLVIYALLWASNGEAGRAPRGALTAKLKKGKTIRQSRLEQRQKRIEFLRRKMEASYDPSSTSDSSRLSSISEECLAESHLDACKRQTMIKLRPILEDQEKYDHFKADLLLHHYRQYPFPEPAEFEKMIHILDKLHIYAKCDFECGICFDRPCDTLLPCNHTGCNICLEESTKLYGTCPFCRAQTNQEIFESMTEEDALKKLCESNFLPLEHRFYP